MTTCVLLLASVATMLVALDHGDIVEGGRDPAPGVVVNATPGVLPFDPPDPTRPTLMIVHGINFLPRASHLPMATRLGEAISRRGGTPLSVLGWDWNGDTLVGVNPAANHEHAVNHGRRLSRALLDLGLSPGRLHLIGQSCGAVVAASAARELREATGRRIAQVTLLDPATIYHELVFRRLAVGSGCGIVEHYWVPGLAGLSRQVREPGVIDQKVKGPGAWRGIVVPGQSAHMTVVRWYIETAARPETGDGFNTSVFAKGG